MTLLPDTNIVSVLLTGRGRVADILRGATRLLISPIVFGELQGGFRAGTRPEENLDLLRRLSLKPWVVSPPLTEVTARIYGIVWASLRAQGTPIPTNDVWLAAQALEEDIELVSRDRHFEFVPGLRLRRL